jgi:hypothetical protein
MTILTQTNQLLQELGQRIGLDGLALDEDGHASLGLDEIFVSLDVQEEADQLLLSAPLGQPGGDRAALYGRMLDANFLGTGTGGATLARSPGNGTIMLWQALPREELEISRFEQRLQSFVDVAEAWAAGIREAADGADVGPPTDTAPEFMIRG